MPDPATLQAIAAHLDRMDPRTQAVLRPLREEPSADPWVRDVLFVYYHYFLRVLFQHADPIRAEYLLAQDLHALVAATATLSLDMSTIEAKLADHFRARGYAFLGGYTLPYRGPYIWKRTEQRVFQVELPDRVQQVTVHFLHDFLLRSWLHFQTYGTQGTGGWYKQGDDAWSDGLYCVVDAWPNKPLEDDLTFQVSLLKHEAQHLADYQDFGELHSIDAEYRAKLVELLGYSTHGQRFNVFLAGARDDRSNPHAYAEHLILTHCATRLLSEPTIRDTQRWQAVPYEQIQGVAHQLLQEHTKQLQHQEQHPKGIL